ncbi:tRNA (adenosine(37)-N6)-threonylcarbamoyltransferase complex ATPase subunit type 1 TsaE [Candidatus Woesebacteria bacterium]|nr:tRNA (adenosine(37)-N6)-threonylcarbamoyltransferase complex ATPase subunit type 1 TsaE [Candidatus Woesebacteria bacterium]|tara:strand:+ start:173 stop:634 length:462 start_codon:yes stop_codon:yes gene_type:complete
MEVLTKSAEETKKFGEKFAHQITGGSVLALVGNLGSGKTTFIQGLARGLGIKRAVISPTFILMREYESKVKIQSSKFKTLYHIDLYRLEEDVEREWIGLGIQDILGKNDTIVVIEWAEKVKELLPKNTIWVKFENVGGDNRKIVTTRNWLTSN